MSSTDKTPQGAEDRQDQRDDKKATKAPVKEKASGKVVTNAKLYVTATMNNTLVTIADNEGHTLCWSSTGSVGFKGSRKSTPYASTVAIETAMNKAKSFGVRQLEVFIKGPGPGRDAAMRFLRNAPFKITQLADVTPLPHNGTRQRKQRHP